MVVFEDVDGEVGEVELDMEVVLLLGWDFWVVDLGILGGVVG